MVDGVPLFGVTAPARPAPATEMRRRPIRDMTAAVTRATTPSIPPRADKVRRASRRAQFTTVTSAPSIPLEPSAGA